jgi:hypothetical protein
MMLATKKGHSVASWIAALAIDVPSRKCVADLVRMWDRSGAAAKNFRDPYFSAYVLAALHVAMHKRVDMRCVLTLKSHTTYLYKPYFIWQQPHKSQ